MNKNMFNLVHQDILLIFHNHHGHFPIFHLLPLHYSTIVSPPFTVTKETSIPLQFPKVSSLLDPTVVEFVFGSNQIAWTKGISNQAPAVFAPF
ncbi:hypothetical protein A2U01_0032277 [Trifolium medium]|uniref:Uncharacterized protein n=1 Tax=Trifolium medium TaxID=97028 RepID=A0A392PHQ6_9FABA|nr:hypothetical protein [Trifolium medium]